MRSILFLLAASCLSLFPVTWASAAIPTVQTANLAELVASARPPVTITGPVHPRNSVNSPGVDWSGDDGKEMARVAALAPLDIQTNGNDLKSVLRAICERSNMRYVLLGDDPVMSSPVTISGQHAPWVFLQTLASLYGIDITLKQGMWLIYAVNNNELIAKTYLLKNNTLEKFSGSGGGGGSSGSSSNNSQPSSGSSNGSSNNVSVDRSGQNVFKVDSGALTAAVQKFLGLQVGSGAHLAAPDGSLGAPGPRRTQAVTGNAGGGTGGLVEFNPDSNTLFVVATRAQHELLADWIAGMDKPRKQILIESKFLLTSRNPKSHTGVTNPLFEDSGISMGLSGLENSAVDPLNARTWKIPSAVLSVSDLNAKLNLLKSESTTSTVQYPTQVTLSGEEVTLRSVRQVPIVSSNTRDTSGSTTNQTAQIQFIDVGTVVAVLPKVLNEKNVLLNISIQVSSIYSTTIIDGNPYPVVTSQTYHNQVIVESGYSLALGGLEQALATDAAKKLPFFGDLPFFGFLARDVSKETTHSVLTMIVTPYVMDGYNGGNTSGIAQHTLPARGTPSRIPFAGSPQSKIEDVQQSLRGFSRDVEEIEQILRENRGNSRYLTKAQLLLNELDLMSIAMKRELMAGRSAPTVTAEIQRYRDRLARVVKDMPRTDPLT